MASSVSANVCVSGPPPCLCACMQPCMCVCVCVCVYSCGSVAALLSPSALACSRTLLWHVPLGERLAHAIMIDDPSALPALTRRIPILSDTAL